MAELPLRGGQTGIQIHDDPVSTGSGFQQGPCAFQARLVVLRQGHQAKVYIGIDAPDLALQCRVQDGFGFVQPVQRYVRFRGHSVRETAVRVQAHGFESILECFVKLPEGLERETQVVVRDRVMGIRLTVQLVGSDAPFQLTAVGVVVRGDVKPLAFARSIPQLKRLLSVFLG